VSEPSSLNVVAGGLSVQLSKKGVQTNRTDPPKPSMIAAKYINISIK